MKILTTEKAVMKIEAENVLTLEVDSRKDKKQIKEEAEKLFEINVSKIRTQMKGNKKIAYLRLGKGSQAVDVATKMGLM